MSLYAHRTCICGRSFTTDCNEYTCSRECEDYAWERQAEREAEDAALDATRPYDPAAGREALR